jgi:hypothetical protein
MPDLLKSASLTPDVSFVDGASIAAAHLSRSGLVLKAATGPTDDEEESPVGWDNIVDIGGAVSRLLYICAGLGELTIVSEPQNVGIKTSSIEQTSNAFHLLVTYTSSTSRERRRDLPRCRTG